MATQTKLWARLMKSNRWYPAVGARPLAAQQTNLKPKGGNRDKGKLSLDFERRTSNERDLKQKTKTRCYFAVRTQTVGKRNKRKRSEADANRPQETTSALPVGEEVWGQFERQLSVLKSWQDPHERRRGCQRDAET